jgi:hypothetical protein
MRRSQERWWWSASSWRPQVCVWQARRIRGWRLGSIIFKGQDALLFQVLAVTTNGTFGNQTFGIYRHA